MDHQVLVCVMNRCADLLYQTNALLECELTAIAVSIDGFAFDVLHDQKRRAIGCPSAVEKASDVWMLQIGEDLSLLSQPALNLSREQTGPHDLDRDLLSIFIVGSLGEINIAHAARTQLA